LLYWIETRSREEFESVGKARKEFSGDGSRKDAQIKAVAQEEDKDSAPKSRTLINLSRKSDSDGARARGYVGLGRRL
jgi:hypothetical protein